LKKDFKINNESEYDDPEIDELKANLKYGFLFSHLPSAVLFFCVMR